MAYNAEQIMSEIQGQNLNNMRNLIIKANNDPRSLTEEQLQLAMQYGQQLGIDMSPSIKRNTGTALENAGAFAGGILDSLAFGFIPDNLYSSYKTKRARNAGELFGTGLSFAIPAFGVGAGAKALLKGAKGLTKLGKIQQSISTLDTISDSAKAIDKADDIIKSANKARESAYNAVKEAKKMMNMPVAKTGSRAKVAGNGFNSKYYIQSNGRKKSLRSLTEEQLLDKMDAIVNKAEKRGQKILADRAKDPDVDFDFPEEVVMSRIAEDVARAKNRAQSLLDNYYKQSGKVGSKKILKEANKSQELYAKNLAEYNNSVTLLKQAKEAKKALISAQIAEKATKEIASSTPKSFMQTPLKDLMPKLSEGSSTLMESMKQIGNTSIAKAQELTPSEILNMAKALVQAGRIPGNVFGTISPDSDLSQLNPYTQSMGIGGMPQMP